MIVLSKCSGIAMQLGIKIKWSTIARGIALGIVGLIVALCVVVLVYATG